MVDNALIFHFARLSSFYQSPVVVLARIAIFLTLLFSIFNQTVLFFFSLLLLIEVFFMAKIERTKPDKVSFSVAKLLVTHSNTKSLGKKLLKTRSIQFFLQKCDISPREVLLLDVGYNEVLTKATEITKKEKLIFVSTVDLMLAYLLETEGQTKLLFKKELKPPDLLNIAHWVRMHFSEVPRSFRAKAWGKGIGEEWVSGWTLETKKYTVDITRKVASNPPQLIGRDKELSQLIESLEKSEKKNALLVGPPGVGKTTIVQSFAYKSFLGELPRELSHRRVLELLSGSLLAGAESQGALEERIRNMLDELLHAGDVLLYLPEIQHVIGAGGRKFDMSGVLIEALTNQEIFVIGTITPENYKSFVEPLTSFAELFETIEVDEPETSEAVRMLEEKALYLESKHGVLFTYKAVYAAVSLSKKYVPYKFLPGKGIDLLDEVAAKTALAKKTQVGPKDVVVLIEEKTHISVGEPTQKEREKLLHLEELLHKRIVNQEEAVRMVSEALRRLRSGLAFENRPVGTFLFLGPTGVGKTETAKALAEIYFGSEEVMVRVDMSEYQHEDAIHRLLGAPVGEARGELTEKVIDKPFSLVLLDEFEKAHPNILDVFLQVFEDGRLTDARGRTVSFVNTIIIATSNAGSELIRERILARGGSPWVQIGGTDELQEKKKLDLKALVPELTDHLQRQGIFKTELLNRFDAIVVFELLGEKEVQEITRLLLNKVVNKLKQKDITVSFDEKVIAKIAREGFDPQFGARPLRRFIQDNVENLMAQKILKEEIRRGNTIVFSTDTANKITLSIKRSE